DADHLSFACDGATACHHSVPTRRSSDLFSTVTSQSVRWSAAVGDPRIPCLRSPLPPGYPGNVGSTRNAVTPPLPRPRSTDAKSRSEEHTSELQSLTNLVCRLLLEKTLTR